MILADWKRRAARLKREVLALSLACRDRRTPLAARVLAACIVAYALSPIDLIPDPIPVLGYLDDVILLPLGISLVLKLIPEPVMEACREQADQMAKNPVSWIGAVLAIVAWLTIATITVIWLWPHLKSWLQIVNL